ncbi:hypothetical protein DER44DRAFT_184096 [Fusarium oxysporum]|nr:hypothetical protein DER44DRAFT_184096 [Fusarium oxysporum]
MPSHLLNGAKAKAKVEKLRKSATREPSLATSSPMHSSVPTQPASEVTTRPPPQAPRSPLTSTEPETSPLSNLQEQIWNQAYDELKRNEPKIVEAFEKIVFAELCGHETSPEFAERTGKEVMSDQTSRSHKMRQLIQDGLGRTKKEGSIKQGIDEGLQAVHTVRGTMDRAVHAAPEAAVAWAAAYLGLEILLNPVTKALENLKGIQYVLSRMEWYWALASLLLDKNKGKTSSAPLRDMLQKEIVQLLQKLLLYQMRSVCLYHRNWVAVGRDMLRIDLWEAHRQLSNIKKAEVAVQRDMEQYNSEESKTQLRKLNDAAGALEKNLQNIHPTMQDQTEQQEKRHEDGKDKQCLQDLRVTDPRTDKKDIEDRKGGLLKEPYLWILEHTDFQRFQNYKECRLLWIKGDPGKGKTMLLCGIIDELERDSSVPLSYFFCQADSGNRLNKATSVLRGLIFDLAHNDPRLIKHVRKKYDYAGKDLFSSQGAWHDLSEIATAMLQDPILEGAILIVDALDECTVNRGRLLEFISKPSPAKWIVSSRNWPDNEEILDDVEKKVKLSLELNQDSISKAVESYIRYKANQLARKRKHERMRDAVLKHLTANADGTILWVALVCQELANHPKQHALGILRSFPPGLSPLYGRMLKQISDSKYAQLCKEILAIALVVYQPITLEMLKVLVEALEDLSIEEVKEVIGLCGSFLTLQNSFVFFVHQSAKDYLLNEASDEILPLGISHQHYVVFSRSLKLLCKTLYRDMYCLQAPGYPIGQVSTPEPDPLATVRYSCMFWVDHLHDSASLTVRSNKMLDSSGSILAFFQTKYVQWLEALALLRSIPAGVRAVEKLALLCQRTDLQHLQDIVKDARRFLLSQKGIIEIAPLQAYVSALIFSPTNSVIRRLFSGEEPNWIELKPRAEENWNACLQTLEGHNGWIRSVVFSNDGQRLASGSDDKTVKIWDATSGTCVQTLEGHDGQVISVVFSNDGQRLASGSDDKTVKIWDATSGTCVQTLEGHDGQVMSAVFANDSQQLASGSADNTVKIWDVTSGAYMQALEGHDGPVMSVVFSDDGQRLASGSADNTVKIWDVTSGAYVQTLEGHDGPVTSVVFSNDGQRLASGSDDKTVKIWDATSGTCVQTLEGHDGWVMSVVFSNDDQRLASGSADQRVKIWDTTSGTCVQTLDDHDGWVMSVVFSNDGQRLTSGSLNKTVKIWDVTSGACVQTLESHYGSVTSVPFSNDGQRLASDDETATSEILLLDEQASMRHSSFNGNGISIDNVWIVKDGTKVLWLPPEHRPVESAVSGSKIALGCRSGRVLVIGFGTTKEG